MSGAIRPHAFGEIDPSAQQFWVEMRDGVRLATDVYLPDGEGPFPTVLTRLPYDKSGEFSFMSEVAERLTPLGLAVVVQDVRGKVRSEGATLAFVCEVPDGWDTLDWIVAQPWSNGDVGTFGDSYYGFTQWAMAFSGHPALKAMVPRMTTTEVGPDWMYLDGVFNLGTMGEWALHTWIDNSLNDVEIDWSGRPIAGFIEHNAGGLPSKSWDEWIVNGPDSAYWTTGIYGREPGPWGKVPALHVGGWFDVFSRGQLRDFERSLSGPASDRQYLVMGALDHFDDHLTEDGRSPDYLRQRELLPSFLDGYLGTAVEFLSHVLLGTDANLPRVRWELGNVGWQTAESWPPPGAAARELHLGRLGDALRGPEGGSIGVEPDPQGGAAEWIHDPGNPVPNLIEDPWRPLLGLPDERPVHMRPDVLTFTGEEQRSPLDLAGPIAVTVVVQADVPSTQVVARLCDVFPDGRTHLIVEGAALVQDPVDPAECRIDLGHTGYRVRAGHRLRLQLSTSSYPRWIVHPGTAEDPFTAVQTCPVSHRLLAGGSHRGTLTLTALPGAGE
jgi:predicted acyl esterase